jgi:ubiquinone/menaquinone biosynthesis C-methylase UbiE
MPSGIIRRIQLLTGDFAMETYVHGYSTIEARRLADQANTLADLLHSQVSFPPGSRVIEAGCGIGAQTVLLARNNPDAQFFSFDASRETIEIARNNVEAAGLKNVLLEVADVYNLAYRAGAFDHAFVCFLLEHLPDPLGALIGLKRILKPGGSIVAIEGDHGSYYCHPRSAAADHVVQCLVDIQSRKGGNALIGRQLYPLLAAAGYKETRVFPRMVYVDASRPDLVDGFTQKTFIAMVEGVKEEALSLGFSSEEAWAQGVADLLRTTRTDGTFCYTFFQATAYSFPSIGTICPSVSRPLP